MTGSDMVFLICILNGRTGVFEAIVGIKRREIWIGLGIGCSRCTLFGRGLICISAEAGREGDGQGRGKGHVLLNGTGVFSGSLEQKRLNRIDLGGRTGCSGKHIRKLHGGTRCQCGLFSLSAIRLGRRSRKGEERRKILWRGIRTARDNSSSGLMNASDMCTRKKLSFPCQGTRIYRLRARLVQIVLLLTKFCNLARVHSLYYPVLYYPENIRSTHSIQGRVRARERARERAKERVRERKRKSKRKKVTLVAPVPVGWPLVQRLFCFEQWMWQLPDPAGPRHPW